MQVSIQTKIAAIHQQMIIEGLFIWKILSLAEYLHNFQPSSETHEAFNLQRKQLVDDTPSKNN